MNSSTRLKDKIYFAKREISLAGSLCKLTAWALPCLFFIAFCFFFFNEEYVLSNFFIVAALAAAILGAPIGALGTIANHQRKQTSLLAIQTWELASLKNVLTGVDEQDDEPDDEFLPLKGSD
tara:strand:- start:128 stop:493 length:366 start_codon:yes stop_codon:yes gene_type:complete